MELFQLKSFLQVAHDGNITHAAETLYLTQPAVTQQIKLLEKELGITLFERTGRGVQLTEAGRAFQEYAVRSLAELEEGKRLIADLQSGTGGTLSIGAGVTTSIFQLPRLLQAFQQQFPGIDVVVRTGRSQEISQLVLERKLDIGIVTSQIEHPELDSIDLFQEEICLVTAPTKAQNQTVISQDEFELLPLILFPKDSGFRIDLERALIQAGLTGWVKMESDSVEAIKSFVSVNLGASFLPESAVQAEIESSKLCKISIENLSPLRRTTTALMRKNRIFSKAASEFIKILTAGRRSGLYG